MYIKQNALLPSDCFTLTLAENEVFVIITIQNELVLALCSREPGVYSTKPRLDYIPSLLPSM